MPIDYGAIFQHFIVDVALGALNGDCRPENRSSGSKEAVTERRRLKGEAACRWMQKISMDTRKSMLEIAEAILLSDEL